MAVEARERRRGKRRVGEVRVRVWIGGGSVENGEIISSDDITAVRVCL